MNYLGIILRYLFFITAIIALTCTVTILVMKGMTNTAMMFTVVLVGVVVILYIKAFGQIRVLHNFIQSHRNTAMKELPIFGTARYDIQAEIENLLSSYRKEIFNETTQQKYYELLLDQVNIGIMSSTADGKIQWMNRTAERLIGSLSATPAEWMKIPNGSTRVVQTERNGTSHDLLVGNTHFTHESGKQILFTLRDIHHVLEEQQIESWKTLTRVLTHEIMNSLSPILSLSETLANPLPVIESSPKYKENMRQALLAIHRRSQGLLNFVENYRKLTRLPEPQLTTISADELFADLRRLFRDTSDNSASITHVEFSQPYNGLTFSADRTQIEQVLINLIKNAIEASVSISDDGEIRHTDIHVSLSRDLLNDEVCISVQDFGTGMSPEVQERIFVPFYTTKPEGSGIGLSLCRQIVHQHHGHILVRSTVGKGSCFTVCIPK